MNNSQITSNKDVLSAKIKALAFAKTETELFLDTHPTSKAALAYYHKINDELMKLTEEYTDKFGPITASGSSVDAWNWIDGPWPWQRKED